MDPVSINSFLQLCLCRGTHTKKLRESRTHTRTHTSGRFCLSSPRLILTHFSVLVFHDEYPAERAHTQFQPSRGTRQGVLALGIICVRALIESWQAEDCPLKRCIHPPQKGDNSERKWDSGNPRGNLGLGFWNKTR